jgi:hypothetical protein
MQNLSELQIEFFNSEVSFKQGKYGPIAKWINYKHPENSSFENSVYWLAYESNGFLIVRYYLSPSDIGNTTLFARIKLNGNSFENVLFDFFINN